MKKFTALLTALCLITLTACGTVHHETVVGQTPGMQVATATQIREIGRFDLVCRDASGNIKWTEQAHNALANVGEQSILGSYFRAATAPTGFYLRLYNTTPALTDTLTTLASYEPSTANGYNPANNSITRDATGWPTLSLVSNHYQVVSKTVTITATGAVGPVTYAAISTSSDNTGTLVAYAALSQSRTLASGDSLALTYTVRLQ